MQLNRGGGARRARKRGGTPRSTNGSGDEGQQQALSTRKARNTNSDTRGGRGASRVQRGSNRQAPTSGSRGRALKPASSSATRPSPAFATKTTSNLPYADRFQQLRQQREVERAEAIKNGFLADPDKPRSLADAITPVGVCPDMCAEFERVERIVQKDVWGPETDPSQANFVPSQRQPDEARMVKKFRRAAAGIDEQLPSDLRPPAVLEKTIDYLFNDVIGQADSLASVHHFVWDRTRAVRNDFSIQQVTKAADIRIAMDCYERIARFHIVSLHQLALPVKPYDKYDAQQEREQLDKTLLSLMQYYDDSRGRAQSPNEAEFRAYCILFQIRDPTPDLEDRVQSWPRDILKSPRVQRALRLYAAAGSILDRQGPLKPESPHPIAQDNWKRFWALIESEEVSYLMACVSEIYFGLVRRNALHSIWSAYRPGGSANPQDWTLSELIEVFGFHDEEEVREFCESFQFSISERADGTEYLDHISVPRGDFPESPSSSSAQSRSQLVEQKRCNRTLPAVINGLSYRAAEKAGALEEPALTEDIDMEQDDALFVRDDSETEEQADAPKLSLASDPVQSISLGTNRLAQAGNLHQQHPEQEASSLASKSANAETPGFSFLPQMQSAPTPANSNPFAQTSEQEENSKSENKQLNPFTFPSQPLKETTSNLAPKSNPLGFPSAPSQFKPAMTQSNPFASTPVPSQSGPANTQSNTFASSPFAAAPGTPQLAQSNPFRQTSSPDTPQSTQPNPFSSAKPAVAPVPSPSVQSNPFSFLQSSPAPSWPQSSQQPVQPNPFASAQLSAVPSTASHSQSDLSGEALSQQTALVPAQSKEPNPSNHTDQRSLPNETDATSIARPSVQNHVSPAVKEEMKNKILDKVSQLIITEPRGFLEQFVEFTVGPLITQAQARAKQERLDQEADDFRTMSLSRRYGIKWRDISWKRRLARVGKERRQRFKEAQARAARSRESSVDADYDALRQSWNGDSRNLKDKSFSNGIRHEMSPPDLPRQADDGPPDISKGQYSHRRVKSSVEQASVPPHSSNWSQQHHPNSVSRKSPLSNEYNPYASYSTPPKRIDTTRSVYFKLKALGIDPNSGASVLSRSDRTGYSRKRSRRSDVDTDMDDDASAMAPPPRKRSHTASSSTSPLLMGASMATARQQQDSLLPSPQPSNSSALTAEDEELFAGLRSVRAAMDESIAFFRTEIAKEEHRQSQSPQRSRESSVAMSGISARSLQRDAPPAYRSRISKFLPREMYADVLMAKRAAKELEYSGTSASMHTKEEEDDDDDDDDDDAITRHGQSWSGKGGTSVEDAIEL